VSVTGDTWASTDAYERFMGRWSRPVAAAFLRWLDVPPGGDWVEVGCGTGALTSVILAAAQPRRVRAYDLSAGFVRAARERVRDPRAWFGEADARRLPEPDLAFDVAVSGLALNFVPEPERALAEMKRVTVPGGTVGVYLWDYSGAMRMLRVFWDAAVELDPAASALDEGERFGLCRPEALQRAFEAAGLQAIDVAALDVPMRFGSFEEYWDPFLGGQGPAPGYVASLDEDRRSELRREIERRLPREPDGSIALAGRAWAARGTA
jgi:SAM-dependent methyltransferase